MNADPQVRQYLDPLLTFEQASASVLNFQDNLDRFGFGFWTGRGAWTSVVYRGCHGRHRGHHPGTARRYSSYRAPNRLCNSGCSNP